MSSLLSAEDPRFENVLNRLKALEHWDEVDRKDGLYAMQRIMELEKRVSQIERVLKGQGLMSE